MELTTTDRLLLRPWSQADAAAHFDIYSRDEVTRWLGARPRRPVTSVDESRERIERWNRAEAGLDPPLGRWAVVPHAVGHPVGTIVLVPLVDEAGPTDLVEVGWHLHPDAQGQGLATEAAAAVLACAREAGMSDVLALTDLDNAASQRVALRLGMTDEGVTDRYYGLTLRAFRVPTG